MQRTIFDTEHERFRAVMDPFFRDEFFRRTGTGGDRAVATCAEKRPGRHRSGAALDGAWPRAQPPAHLPDPLPALGNLVRAHRRDRPAADA